MENIIRRAPVIVNPVLLNPQEKRSSLNGGWSFKLDPDDKGLQERWYEDNQIISDKIEVPGSWQGQGFGGMEKNIVWDFRLETRTFRATYTGTGWYGVRFEIPDDWEGMRLWANFGGVHPSAEVWLNGVRLGENNLPFVPFAFEITGVVRSDDDNLLVVRVHEENRILGLAYSWQGNWSGLYRGVELTATGENFLQGFSVYPNIESEKLQIKTGIGGDHPLDGGLSLRVSAQLINGDTTPVSTKVEISGESVEFDLPLPSPRLWSPDSPNLYRVDAVLTGNDKVLDALSERVGFVQLSTEGKHFLINGEPYYMRGSGDFISNPETGSPDTNRDRWRKKLSALREYGYNYVRCQSYVYTPEYFDVADEVGLLIQSEMGMLGGWSGNQIWHVSQWPQPSPDYRDALKRQWDSVVLRDVNHPSANLYCMSNELRDGTEHPRIAWSCYHDTKAIKPTAFVLWTDGGYRENLPGDFVNHEADIDSECSKPLIQHEFRWWSSFPDVRNMEKYSGAIRSYGAEIALEAAAGHGISHVLPTAAANSQRIQYIEAKGKMEACRRDNPSLAGICHFNAMDINPSPQGIIDEFYDLKYADGGSWQQTNGDTVILSDLGFDDRVLASADTLRTTLYVSDFSHLPLNNPVLEWKLETLNETISEGSFSYPHKPFSTCTAGNIEATVPEVSKPTVASLKVALHEGKRVLVNSWDLWLFPKSVVFPPEIGIYGKPQHTWLEGLGGIRSVSLDDLSGDRSVLAVLTETLDGAVVEFARSGGRIILVASEGLVRPSRSKLLLEMGRYFFTPPANYPPYEDGINGTIILDHPMLGDFPQEGFADLQFFRMMGESPPIDIEPLGLNKGDPVIRAIHSYQVSRPLAYLTESSLGKGGLIICSLNLDQSLPESRYLLAQICNYALGDDFNPQIELSNESLTLIVAGTQIS